MQIRRRPLVCVAELVQFTMRFNKVTQTYENGGITNAWDTNSQA